MENAMPCAEPGALNKNPGTVAKLAALGIEPLLSPHEAIAALGLRTKTSHTLRNLERRGLLRPVRLSARCIRYHVADVQRLVAGGAA